jgi:hypothetical protein
MELEIFRATLQTHATLNFRIYLVFSSNHDILEPGSTQKGWNEVSRHILTTETCFDVPCPCGTQKIKSKIAV